MKSLHRDRNNIKHVALVGSALVLVFALSFIRQPSWLQSFAHTTLAPSLARIADMSHRGFAALGIVNSFSELEAENKKLRETLEAFAVERRAQELVREENTALKEALLKAERTVRTPAPVLKEPPHTLYDTLLLGAGEVHGVSVGDRIFVDEVVIGKIIRTEQHTSLGLLYSSAQEKTAGFLHASTTYPTVIQGAGGQSMFVELPKGAMLEVGDAITLRDDASHVLGFIEVIENDDRDPVITAWFSYPINVLERSFVEIETGVQ